MRRRNEKVAVLLAGAAITLAITGCSGDKFTLTNETVTVELGSEPSDNVTDYITFKDGVSDNKKQEILDNTVLDFSDVDMSKVGDYTATITYDKTSLTFTVEVQDTTAPVGTLVNEIAEFQTGDEVKAADLVAGVEDAQDVTVEFVTSTLESVDFDTEAQAEGASEDADTEATDETAEEASDEGAENAEEAVQGEADTTEDVNDEETAEAHTFDGAGKYEIVIRLTDASGNKTELTQRIIVADPDTTDPEIKGVKNRTVYVGGTVDYLKGVTATDDVDGDVTDKISVDSSAVDTKKAGTYTVTYTVSDTAGNEAVKEAKLTVSVKPAPKPAATAQTPTTTTGASDSSSSSSSGGGSSSGSSSSSNSSSDSGSTPSSSSASSGSDSSSGSSSESSGSSSDSGNSSSSGDVIKNSDSWGNVSGQGTLFGGLPDE